MDPEKKPGIKPGTTQPKKRSLDQALSNPKDPTRIDYFKDIVGTIREPLLVLDKDLRVLSANHSFYKFFKVNKKETLGVLIYDLGNRQWDIPVLRDLLETILPQKAVFNDFLVEHAFPSIGKRSLLLNARRISASPRAGQWILLAFEDISERRLLEQALQASEERFHKAFETAHDSMLLIKKNSGQIVNSNQAAQAALGYSKLTFKKKKLWELGVLKDELHFRQTALELEERGSVGLPDLDIPTRRGDHFPADVFLTDRAAVIQCNIRDISERKRSEQALLESEEKYRSLVNEVNDGFYVSDAGGFFTFANPALARIYGFETPQALIGHKFMDFIAPERFVDLDEAQRSNIHSGQAPELIKGQIVRPDGTRAYVDIKAVPVLQNGRIVGSQGVVRDVTERMLAEEKLKEERILLRTLIDNLPDRVYVMDVQGRKIISNIADWQTAGANSIEEVIGKTDLETFPPELANAYWALDRSVIDSGESLINREEPGLDAHGKPAWLLSSKVPLLDGQGKVVGLVGIGRDITERKHRDEEIRALYQFSRQLADANDLAAVIELVNRQAVELVHTTFAGIALLEEADLVPRAIHPVRELGQDFNVGTRRSLDFLPVCRKVLETNEPLSLPADSLELGSAERKLLLLDFARSVCLVPLRVGAPDQGASQAMGLLILGEARANSREPFTPEKLRLARSLGDQAASAIRRMLTREQSERRLQQLASLGEIDRTIASVMDLRISLQMILRHVCERLEVDAADVLVFNETLQTLEFSAGRGFRSGAIQAKQQRLGEGQAGKAAIERHLIQIPDLAASQAVFAWPDLLKTEQVQAYFAVPLITKGKVKGVMEIYHRSPLDPNEEWLDFLNTLAGQAAIGIENIQLINNLQRSTDELELAYDATIEGWSHALDLRDKETEGHTQRVTDRTVKLARRFGISEKELVQVRWGALLHDIGKMGVPDGILLKPGPLTDEEWVVMKKHPGLAYEMLEPIHYLGKALDIPYCHHEKWDGSGYPRGLKGMQIPVPARMFAVVDVYDALTSDRPYRKAWPKEQALDYIRDQSGKHFDPEVVNIFLTVMSGAL